MDHEDTKLKRTAAFKFLSHDALDLWQSRDPELQPMVHAANRRRERLKKAMGERDARRSPP